MNKYLLGCLSLFMLSTQVSAGVKMHCPNLQKGERTRGWQVLGTVNENHFKKVLISETHVLGNNSVTCKYKGSVRLLKIGDFQPGDKSGFWEKIVSGGLYFKQCLATPEKCFFYSANPV